MCNSLNLWYYKWGYYAIYLFMSMTWVIIISISKIGKCYKSPFPNFILIYLLINY
jgi:hypothetical protein